MQLATGEVHRIPTFFEVRPQGWYKNNQKHAEDVETHIDMSTALDSIPAVASNKGQKPWPQEATMANL